MEKTKQQKFYEYYASASESAATRDRFRATQRAVMGVVSRNGNADRKYDVVDVGCGAGTQSLMWAEDGHRVTAIDINEDLVNLGRERAGQVGAAVTFHVGSATRLPVPDQSADIVLVPELLEHVAEWPEVLDECARIVRPGGYVYLSTTNRMCPVQHEFELPLYSWYPKAVQRYCEEKARTTRPEWANFADYPAVTWFTPYGLAREMKDRGFSETFDRFDINYVRQTGGARRRILGMIRAVPPLRWAAHIATPYSVVVAQK